MECISIVFHFKAFTTHQGKSSPHNVCSSALSISINTTGAGLINEDTFLCSDFKVFSQVYFSHNESTFSKTLPSKLKLTISVVRVDPKLFHLKKKEYYR